MGRAKGLSLGRVRTFFLIVLGFLTAAAFIAIGTASYAQGVSPAVSGGVQEAQDAADQNVLQPDQAIREAEGAGAVQDPNSFAQSLTGELDNPTDMVPMDEQGGTTANGGGGGGTTETGGMGGGGGATGGGGGGGGGGTAAATSAATSAATATAGATATASATATATAEATALPDTGGPLEVPGALMLIVGYGLLGITAFFAVRFVGSTS